MSGDGCSHEMALSPDTGTEIRPAMEHNDAGTAEQNNNDDDKRT